MLSTYCNHLVPPFQRLGCTLRPFGLIMFLLATLLLLILEDCSSYQRDARTYATERSHPHPSIGKTMTKDQSFVSADHISDLETTTVPRSLKRPGSTSAISTA